MLHRPEASQPHYGENLGNADYWSPWVKEVLDRHALPHVPLDSPFVGSFPTFLVGGVAVKLLGDSFEGPTCFATEVAMLELLADIAAVPAPRMLASGALFDDAPRWHYIVTERLGGVALRDAKNARRDVAGELGQVVAELHRLSPPAPLHGDLAELRAAAPQRARRFGHLPERLIEQIPDFLADALEADTLVHADLTEDHVFVKERRLVGIIDWGDAMLADPYYELVPVFFDSIGIDPEARRAFLEGYDWVVNDDFPRRMMQAVLEFEFGVTRRIAQLIELATVSTLDDLAERLFPL